jgi:hypothetical protein
MNHINESIFDGEHTVIALAEVVGFEKMDPVTRKLSPSSSVTQSRIRIIFRGSPTGDIFLLGQDAVNFSSDWCRYRRELESPPAEINVQIEPSLTKAQSRALSMITPIGCSTANRPTLNPDVTAKIAEHLDALGVGHFQLPAAAASVSDAMVSRFLGWKLPSDFAPDCGISFDGRKDDEWNKNLTWPIGTNLFTANQAKAMLEHVLGVAKSETKSDDQQQDTEGKQGRIGSGG